jgi:CheY-like chemotaxis protein
MRVGQNSPSRSTVTRDTFHALAARAAVRTIERHSAAPGYPLSGVFSRTVMPPHRVMANNRSIARPKVLIVTPHPVIGAGLETVLRLEDLYDLRRVASLTDAASVATSWPADAAVVDGMLLDEHAVDLAIPSTILTGDAESGGRLVDRVPGARGWLPKDAPPARLVAAIDRSLGIVRVRDDARGTLGMILAVLIVIAFVAALALFVWRYFLS